MTSKTNIDDVEAYQRNGRTVIDWRFDDPALFTDRNGKPRRFRSQGRNAGEARRRARDKAEQLLSTLNTDWARDSPISAYIESVTRPLVEGKAARGELSPATMSRYRPALAMILQRVDRVSIHRATRPRFVETMLSDIANSHGYGQMHQARTVYSRYVLDQLVKDEVLDGNPLRSVKLDTPKAPPRTRGGRSITLNQWRSLLDWLLSLDPSEGVESPIRGRWRYEDRLAIRRNVIDLTLLQATTGLRISEARTLKWAQVKINGSDILVPLDHNTKTSRGRYLQVLDPRVSERLLTRPRGTYVIGSPADPDKEWERRNCAKRIAELYQEIASELDINLMQHERTHLWRTTLNNLTAGLVPEADRAAWFGHSREVNRRHYNDASDISRMVEAGRRLLDAPHKTPQPGVISGDPE